MCVKWFHSWFTVGKNAGGKLLREELPTEALVISGYRIEFNVPLTGETSEFPSYPPVAI